MSAHPLYYGHSRRKSNMNVPQGSDTFALRNPFPGLGKLLNAVNLLVASKEFFLRFFTDSETPYILSICVYGRRSDNPTLTIRAGLNDSVSQEQIRQVGNKLQSGAKKSSSENYFLFTDTTESTVTVKYGAFAVNFLPTTSVISEADIVHRHEYSFRKLAPGIGSVISAITTLVNLRNESGYLYSLQASLDNIESKWFRLKLKHMRDAQHCGDNEATVMLRRRLKSVTNADKRNLSLLNFAAAFGAPIEFRCNDDIHLLVLIGIPADDDSWEKLQTNMNYLV